MAGSLGIGVSLDGQGLSAKNHRLLIACKWENTGIISGLEVSGRNDLTYNVALGACICQRFSDDGKTETVWTGGTTAAVAAGDSANPRIDCIYIIARNKLEHRDETNQTEIGVVQGTPAASPTNPTPPAGALALAYMRMPAGATTTQSASRVGSRQFAVRHGDKLPRFGYVQRTDALTIKGSTLVNALSVKINLPTDRLLRIECTCAANSVNGNNQAAELNARIYIDGKAVAGGEKRNHEFRQAWCTWQPYWSDVYCVEGVHTVSLMLANGYGAASVVRGKDDWGGLILSVKDDGVTE